MGDAEAESNTPSEPSGIIQRGLRRVSARGGSTRGLAGLSKMRSSKTMMSAPPVSQSCDTGSLGGLALPEVDEAPEAVEPVDLGWVGDQMENKIHHRGQTQIDVGRWEAAVCDVGYLLPPADCYRSRHRCRSAPKRLRRYSAADCYCC